VKKLCLLNNKPYALKLILVALFLVSCQSADTHSKAIAVDRQKWLEINFSGKTNAEAKKSLSLLQRDIAIISAIVNHMDSDQVRKETEDSYENLIE